MLILGGSATVTDLTGMSTQAVRILDILQSSTRRLTLWHQACFLIPLGVAIYVVAGGMRATLLCD